MTKYRTILLISVFFLFACNHDEKRAKLLIPKSKINLEVINFDSTYSIAYTLINTGDRTLIIDTVTASCGCTIPDIQKKNINPLDSSQLIVKYKPVDTGYFDKKIIIKSNIDSTFSVVSFNGRAIK
jgi:hypothetical protein